MELANGSKVDKLLVVDKVMHDYFPLLQTSK